MKPIPQLLLMGLIGTVFVSALVFAEDATDDDLVIGPRAPEKKETLRKDVKAPIAQAPVQFSVRDLASPDLSKVRQAAMDLASTGNVGALQYFWALYAQGDAARRAIAIQCVGILGQPGQEDNLFRAAIADGSASVQRTAIQALIRLHAAEKVAPRFIQTANDARLPNVQRVRALISLAWLRTKSAGAVLTGWLKSAESEMATGAAEAMGILGDLSQADTLISMLSTPNLELKPAVAEALERLTGKKFHYDLVKWSEWKKEQANAAIDTSKESTATSDYVVPFHNPDSPVDIAFVFDTTGSMLHVWPEVVATLDAIVDVWTKQNPSVRVGCVKYRSMNAHKALSYSTETTALSRQTDVIVRKMRDSTFGGGSGGPQIGLYEALSALCWRTEARKIIILIGDISPQVDEAEDADTLPGSEAVDEAGLRRAVFQVQESWLLDGFMVNTVYVKTVHGEAHRNTYRLLGLSGGGHFYEYDKKRKHLVEAGLPLEAQKLELPEDTAIKWLTPRAK